MYTKHSFLCAVAFFLTSLVGYSVGHADDTEIFFAQGAGAPSTHPNILFILDDSGSMRGSRMTQMKAAMTSILNSVNDVNVGLMSFDWHHTVPCRGCAYILHRAQGDLIHPVSSVNDAGEKAQMLSKVASLNANGGTPLVGALHTAANYMTGNSGPMIGACQNNHIVMLSDGYPTGTVLNSAGLKGLMSNASCSDASVSSSYCGNELATWLSNKDHKPNLARNQNVTVHTVGFHLTNSVFLTGIADAGGGGYYEASSSAELLTVFQDIIGEVADIDTTFVAPATSLSHANRLANSNDVYFSLFKPAESAKWGGNLKRYSLGVRNDHVVLLDRNGNPAIDPTTGYFADTANSYWGSAATADGASVLAGGVSNLLTTPRRLYTYVGDVNTVNGGVTFTASSPIEHQIHESNPDISLSMLGFNNGTTTKTQMLTWARGVDVNDWDEDSSTSDVRQSIGDPLHSSPVVLHYGDNIASARQSVFVGTNEGYLHSFDADTGEENFAFMPRELIQNIGSYYASDGNFERPYGLDGGISVLHQDTDGNKLINNGEKAYLYVGMRRGGRNYYAFDVSNRNSIRLMWQINGGSPQYPLLGQTWSKPVTTSIMHNGAKTDVLIFGGGYDTNQDPAQGNSGAPRSEDNIGRAIYIVNAVTGDNIWTGDMSRFSDMKYSIPSNLRVIDTNGDDLADQIFVGDMGGQVWRFDIASYHQTGESLVYGGVLASLAQNGAANSRRFFNEPDVAVINEKGQQFLSISIGSGWRANPLNKTIKDRFYVIKDFTPRTRPEGYGYRNGPVWDVITERDLNNVTDDLRQDINATLGWYIELEGRGEKSLSKAVTINNQVFFSTYEPGVASNLCSPAVGAGSLYAVSVFNGNPVMNLTAGSGGVLTAFEKSFRKKRLGADGIPSSPVPDIVEDSSGKIHTGLRVGTENIENVDFSILTRRTYWQDKGRGPETPTEVAVVP